MSTGTVYSPCRLCEVKLDHLSGSEHTLDSRWLNFCPQKLLKMLYKDAAMAPLNSSPPYSSSTQHAAHFRSVSTTKIHSIRSGSYVHQTLPTSTFLCRTSKTPCPRTAAECQASIPTPPGFGPDQYHPNIPQPANLPGVYQPLHPSNPH